MYHLLCLHFSPQKISFLLPHDSIPGRMGFLLTLFLCMVNTLNSMAQNAPNSGGSTTAIIQWILSCLLFMILAILEYALILGYKKYRKDYLRRECPNFRRMTRRIDRHMLVIIPPTFFTFSVIFWSIHALWMYSSDIFCSHCKSIKVGIVNGLLWRTLSQNVSAPQYCKPPGHILPQEIYQALLWQSIFPAQTRKGKKRAQNMVWKNTKDPSTIL